MEDYPLISVVIPVYKVEQYIHECVDSVIAQTYKNLDIILVDDGSPDSCPAICDEYAERDNRIRVIHKKNGGLSSARNAGIDIARGEYICFVDSDDYVSEIYVEQLYTTLKESGADMACTMIALERKRETLAHAIIHKHELLSGEEALRKTLLVVLWSAYGGVPTALVYLRRKEVLCDSLRG